MVVVDTSSAPSILFPPLLGGKEEKPQHHQQQQHQHRVLPIGRTEELLSWISRFGTKLDDLRRGRRRDLRLEALLSVSGSSAQAQLDATRRERRQRWTSLCPRAGCADVGGGKPPEQPSLPPLLAEESSRLDSFFDHMDLVTRASRMKKKRPIIRPPGEREDDDDDRWCQEEAKRLRVEDGFFFDLSWRQRSDAAMDSRCSPISSR